jgi:hypothetical protein
MPRAFGGWDADALAWEAEGVSCAVMALRWGCSHTAACGRLMRAQQRANIKSAPSEIPSKRVERRLVALEDAVVRLIGLVEALGAGSVQTPPSVDIEAIAARLEKAIAAAAAAPVLAAPSKTDHDKGTPALWVWIATECARAIGDQAAARALDVEIATLRQWCGGTVPKSAHREELKHLLATLWARETFVDFDDLLEARERTLRYASDRAVGV